MSDCLSISSSHELPFVSVIIPTYRDWQRLSSCVDALIVQNYPSEKFEVIIINNDPEDLPRALSFPPNFRLVCEERRGAYAARNKGLGVAAGALVAFTDSDCIPDKDWLKSAVNYLARHPSVKRLGGRVELFFRGEKLNFAEIYEKAFSFRQKDYVERLSVAATANMFTYKDIFHKVGLFDEEFFSGGDFEWGMRAQESGYPIAYCEESFVLHPSRTTLKEILDKSRRAGGGAYVVAKKMGWVLSLAKGFAPPVLDGYRVLLRGDLSLKEKFISIGIKYLSKLVLNIERFRIIFLGKEPENI